MHILSIKEISDSNAPPLGQLDISGIALGSGDFKNDSSGFGVPKLPSLTQLNKKGGSNTAVSGATATTPVNTSFSYLQKSPSKVYTTTTTPGPQPGLRGLLLSLSHPLTPSLRPQDGLNEHRRCRRKHRYRQRIWHDPKRELRLDRSN